MTEPGATSPCAGLLPVAAGGLRVTEVAPGPVHLIAPLKGQAGAVSAALRASLGLEFPPPNETRTARMARLVWVGGDQALLCGAPPPDLPGAAVTDLSDAFAAVRIEGPGVEAALARLVPVDLRAQVFPEGRTARTLVGHLTASVTRCGPDAFEIMAKRSMAGTLVQDLSRAVRQVVARAVPP